MTKARKKTKKVEFTVVIEDTAHESFVVQMLRRRGYNFRQFRVIDVPAGQGAGDVHVLQKYPDEVNALRRSSSSSRGLVVMIDADTHSVTDRQNALDGELLDAGFDRRGEGERICLLIPRRHIETWAAFFNGQDVDEQTNYRQAIDSDAIKSAGRSFADAVATGLDADAPDSLRIGLGEAKARLP